MYVIYTILLAFFKRICILSVIILLQQLIMQEISHYFASLWYNTKESNIFVTVWKLWSKPASTIAQVCGHERVYTYKALQQFVADGIMAETMSKGIKHFWIPSLDLLKQSVLRHEQKYRILDEQFAYIQTAFDQISPQYQSPAPKLQLFEQEHGIKQLFDDIINHISTNQLITIKCFATNTFDTQMRSNQTIFHYADDFFTHLQRNKITIQSYLADWSLTMEYLRYLESYDIMQSLPAGNNAVNIFIVGTIFYLIIYKDNPIWLKIASPELAWAMHFLLEQTNREK